MKVTMMTVMLCVCLSGSIVSNDLMAHVWKDPLHKTEVIVEGGDKYLPVDIHVADLDQQIVVTAKLQRRYHNKLFIRCNVDVQLLDKNKNTLTSKSIFVYQKTRKPVKLIKIPFSATFNKQVTQDYSVRIITC